LSAPPVNESRVAEIKAAVNAGTYQIDPARVADKMMQLETKIANST
jgi:negative regulator of flagellin synthesis FlgM